MNKTILFFLAHVLAATTACGRGSSNNNPVKEETMEVTNRLLWISMLTGVVLAKW